MRWWETDRTVMGAIIPVGPLLTLPNPLGLRSTLFPERGEAGLINLGGPGVVTVDGTAYALAQADALYLGRGNKAVTFASNEVSQPARFWLMSYPAHREYPVTHVPLKDARGERLGTRDHANERTLFRLIHPGAMPICQLVMGFTRLEPGGVWNSMPPHTHLRRSEVYLYFNLPPGQMVCHLMGKPQATRHLLVHDGEAVLSPPWSIHCGCGTSATFGGADILVNNAGTIRRASLLDFAEQDWDEVLQLNLNAPLFLSQEFARRLVARRVKGKIINIASMLSFQGGVRVASYTASKSALHGLTKLMANELAGKGINVNALAPGYMVTDNTEPLRADAARSRSILDRIPPGRWGTPEDLNGAIVFLPSAASDYMHGFTLAVDGFFLLVVLITQYFGNVQHFGSMAAPLAVAAICIAAAHQAWSANIFTLVSDMFPKRAVGTVTGIGAMAGGLGGVVVQKLAGALTDHFIAQPQIAYGLMFCLCAISYLLAWGGIKLVVAQPRAITDL